METSNIKLKAITLLRSVKSYYIDIEYNGLIHCYGVTQSEGNNFDYFNLVEIFKINDGNYQEYKKLRKSVKKLMRKLAEEKFNEYCK